MFVPLSLFCWGVGAWPTVTDVKIVHVWPNSLALLPCYCFFDYTRPAVWRHFISNHLYSPMFCVRSDQRLGERWKAVAACVHLQPAAVGNGAGIKQALGWLHATHGTACGSESFKASRSASRPWGEAKVDTCLSGAAVDRPMLCLLPGHAASTVHIRPI